MHPVTHLLAGWVVANGAQLSNRDRLVVTLAGVAPAVDGIGFALEFATRNSTEPLLWYSNYHHVLGHNLGFALACFLIALAVGVRRWVAALLALVSVHVHLFCDLIGSGAADGYQWPIPYLEPFSAACQLTWSGQWPLSSWQNNLITALLLGVTAYLAWRRGFSPLGILAPRADRVFVNTLRARFGVPGSSG